MACKELTSRSSVPVQGDIVIVGLAGPSGSGKSTVAKRVASRLNGQVISMENYCLQMNHLLLKERAVWITMHRTQWT
jgi:uridine kinase